jgi:hypothetical protein
MKKIAYWHVYLTEDVGSWAGIVMEQLGVMERSGLLRALDDLRITCIHRNWSEARMFTGIVEHARPQSFISFVGNCFATDQEMLENISSPDAVTEATTLYKMYLGAQIAEFQQEEAHLLYFHTKGITADERYLKSGNFEEYKKYYYWRQMLNWAVLDRWSICTAALEDGYDIAGANFQKEPYPHYSGGFYWTKTSHVKKLPDPLKVGWWKSIQSKTNDPWLKTAPERFRNEMWITQTEDYNALCLAQGIDNPASKFVSTREYWK